MAIGLLPTSSEIACEVVPDGTAESLTVIIAEESLAVGVTEILSVS